METQLLLENDVSIVSTSKHAATIRRHILSSPNLMILEFGWKMKGAHCHLYEKVSGDWKQRRKAQTVHELLGFASTIQKGSIL